MLMTLKEFILKNYSQIEIFAEYLTISEDDIAFSAKHNSKIKSPFHRDSDPSLSFRYYGERLICRDFSSINFSGDVFAIVGEFVGKDPSNKVHFIEICKHIINTMERKNSVHISKPIAEDKTLSISEPTDISFVSRNLNDKDYKHFYQYFINRNVVAENYSAVRTYFINGFPSNYYSSAVDPCYAYVNNPDCIKLVFPFRRKNEKRFITNNRVPVELLHTISKKDFTILIKGFKDKLLMDIVCKHLNINNVQFLPLASESARINAELFTLLKSYTNKRLFTLFDIDKAGVEASIYYRDNYGFSNLFLGDNHSTKDPTDLARVIKFEPFVKRFYNIYKTF